MEELKLYGASDNPLESARTGYVQILPLKEDTFVLPNIQYIYFKIFYYSC